MKTSKQGIALIQKFESLHDGDLKQIGLQPKRCPAGIWTEGWGRVMRDFKGNMLRGSVMPKGTISTEAEALQYLYEDLSVFETIVLRKVKRELKQNEFDSLVCHTYNTGGSDTLFKLVSQNAPIQQIKKWWTNKYITANGLPLRGLQRRRNEEFEMFNN